MADEVKAKKDKGPKHTVKLSSKNPLKSLVVRAKGKNGKFEAYSTYTERAKDTNKINKSQRGTSSVHDTFEGAKAAADQVVAQALKAGWIQKARSGASKVDAFDLKNLPTA